MTDQLLFAVDSNKSKLLSKETLKGNLRRIYRGIYTDNFDLPFDLLVSQNWMPIVAFLVPGGILAFRTGLELKPVPFRDRTIVFVISRYFKTFQLPGLIIKVLKGNPDEWTEPVLPNLERSQSTRLLLENLSVVRGAEYHGVKTVGEQEIEIRLAKILRLRGEKGLNQIRDEAKVIAENLGYQYEYEKLNRIIRVLLSTQEEDESLTSAYANFILQKPPCDPERIKLFELLAQYLKTCEFYLRPYEYNKITFKNISFFESYFSNFIEGTEFEIDEAEDIVFKNQEIKNRHEDSHDVLAHFLMSNDYNEMTIVPNSAEELLEILKYRHQLLMKERPDKSPGQFKTKPNKAGSTHFVQPDEVIGTLMQGFKIYQALQPGLERALMMHYLISEVHPFTDGNGRLSRIMMNAELTNTNLYKIIMPSVHRDNYLNGLRIASRQDQFHIYCKVIDQAQAYTASIDWRDYGEARSKLENDYANRESDQGLPIFNRILRGLKLSLLG